MTDNTQTLLVFAGLPGVGKSTAIETLASLHDITTHSSDCIRKELFDPVTYSGEESKATYEELYDRTRTSLTDGNDTVIDGTMSLKHGRDTAANIASTTNSNIMFVKVECRPEIAKQRIRDRCNADDAVSDADVTVYENFDFEPFDREHVTITNNHGIQQLQEQLTEAVTPKL